MFTSILCATDGSQHADRAVRYATELAREDGSELHVVHVIERLVGRRMYGENVFVDEAEIDHRLKAQTAEIVRESGVSASLHLVKGRTTHVAERLAGIADDLDVDLIVLGTRGHSALGGLVLGSVTQRLLHVTSRPVLALPPMHGPQRRSAPAERLDRAA
jgi:nucleotide-binding universal stress UspA family protein